MSHLPVLLAVINEFEQIDSYQRNVLTSGLTESEIIFGAVALVILLSFIGVFVFRKQLLRRRRKHHRHRPPVHALSAQASAKSHRKRRRVRRKHRPSNPTLADTGGLPPHRSEGSTASSPP